MCVPKVTDMYPWLARTPSHPTCMVMVGVVRPLAAVSVVCAADTVMAVGLITWLDRVAMVPNVVMGVAREALVLWPPAPARLVETVPVTVPRVVTPEGREKQDWDEACCHCPFSSCFSLWTGLEGTECPQWERKAPERAPASSPSPPMGGGPKKDMQSGYTPVVPFTTNVVTAGLTAETVTGVTRRTPPMGTVRRMVPGCPGAPFSTTWNIRGQRPQRHSRAGWTLCCPLPGPPGGHMCLLGVLWTLE